MTTTLNASTAGAGGFIATSDNSGALALQTAGTTAVTIDSGQNVSIGTTGNSTNDQVGAGRPLVVARSDANTTIGGSTASIVIGNSDTTTNNTSQLNFAAITGASATFFASAAINCIFGARTNGQYPTGQLTFSTSTALNNAPSEKMRLDNNGNLLVGTTGISTGSFKGIQCGVNSGGFPNYLSNNPAGTANRNWSFGMNNADQFAVYGYNTTTFNTGAYIAWGGTSWTASSDERKKDIIEPIQNGLQKVSTLRAVIGKYKTDEEGTRRSFLIAQDLQAVLPEAVDASNPDDLGVQYTEVIPLLVSAIKELKAINDTQAATINALTARIVAIESKGTV